MTKPNWGKLIREVRIELGETQAVFGARFGVSITAVSFWENGQTDPPGDVTWWVLDYRDHHRASELAPTPAAPVVRRLRGHERPTLHQDIRADALAEEGIDG